MIRDTIDTTLHTKLAGAEVAPPADSWSGLQSRRRWRRVRSLAVAAGSVAAIVTAAIMLTVQPDVESPKMREIASQTAPAQYSRRNVEQQPAAAAPVFAMRMPAEVVAEQEVAPEPIIEVVTIEEPKAQSPQRHPAASADDEGFNPRNKAGVWYPPFDYDWATPEPVRNREAVKLQIFANFSNMVRSGNVADVAQSADGHYRGLMAVQMGTFTNNVDFSKSELRHKFPLSVGVGLSIPLSQNFSLETGLNYSHLESSAAASQGVFRYDYTQKVDYLGVPVGVSYKILKIKSLDLYATAGAMAEVALDATGVTTISSDGEAISTHDSVVEAAGLQMSANAAFGVNLDITPTVGFYAEPGVSCYIPSSTQPVTARTQTTLHFNLRAGFRIKL